VAASAVEAAADAVLGHRSQVQAPSGHEQGKQIVVQGWLVTLWGIGHHCIDEEEDGMFLFLSI